MKAFLCLLALTLLCSNALASPASASVAARNERVSPAGEVVVVLSEEFLNSLLAAVASQPEPPSFPLSKDDAKGKCASQVQLLREAVGTRTAVRFVDGRITAPVAFRGSYEAPLFGCISFEGWADTSFQLEFDQSKQSLNARVTIRDLNLKNIPTSLLGGGLSGLVQDSIDSRVNPVQILRAEQLGVPIMRGNGLRIRAREVRHEIAGKSCGCVSFTKWFRRSDWLRNLCAAINLRWRDWRRLACQRSPTPHSCAGVST